jgi:hypothetical protein
VRWTTSAAPIVRCLNENGQIQALHRTQPELPLNKGRAGTMTYGTSTLFAAMSILAAR